MTRSIAVQAKDVVHAYKAYNNIFIKKAEIGRITEATSSHVTFLDMHMELVGNLIYIRLEMKTGEASGHNMVTKASDAVLQWILKTHSELTYVTISGNYCTDKKVSAVNGILGRGKNVV